MASSKEREAYERVMRVRAIPLHEIATRGVLDEVYEDLAFAFEHGEYATQELALERLTKALWTEGSAMARGDFEAAPPKERLAPFFARVEREQDHPERLLEALSIAAIYAAGEGGVREVMVRWLDSLPAKRFSRDLVTAMGLECLDAASAETGARVLGLLEHSAPKVRARAAAKLGEAYESGDTTALPPVVETMARLAEIERRLPGVAGPFFGAIQFDAARILGEGFDIQSWMLDILANRPGPEPEIGLNGIDFYAHEWLSFRPDAVRRMISLGLVDLAIETATEDVVPEMKEVLIELAASGSEQIVRRASWHLAYHHRVAHPKGVEMGFVIADARAGYEAFYLFSEAGAVSPYAAAIYPAKVTATFDDLDVERIVGALFPTHARGGLIEPAHNTVPANPWLLGNHLTHYYARGTYVQRIGDVKEHVWSCVHVGYRGPPGGWDPLGRATPRAPS